MSRDDPRRRQHPSPWPRTANPAHARRGDELRLHGVNACLAAFAHRPEGLRKLWLTQANLPAFRAVLAWCVQHRIGYRMVESDEIERLTGSSHHEDVCMAMQRTVAPSLAQLLAAIEPAAPTLLLWLHGVGNPHNLGAILRSAAHFDVRAVLLSEGSALSAAAYRVAEGGAEALPCVASTDVATTCDALHAAGFALAATVVRGGQSLYAQPLPSRAVLLLGAEQTGLPHALTDRADLRLRIPGSGAVESLNVAVAAALLVAEWARVHALDG